MNPVRSGGDSLMSGTCTMLVIAYWVLLCALTDVGRDFRLSQLNTPVKGSVQAHHTVTSWLGARRLLLNILIKQILEFLLWNTSPKLPKLTSWLLEAGARDQYKTVIHLKSRTSIDVSRKTWITSQVDMSMSRKEGKNRATGQLLHKAFGQKSYSHEQTVGCS